MVEAVNAIELKNITKRFGEKVIANDSVNLTVRKGEILSLLGENGRLGKTTLMNMLSGIYSRLKDRIFVNGLRSWVISSPKKMLLIWGIGNDPSAFWVNRSADSSREYHSGIAGKDDVEHG
ncbi:MAG: ATP-binding cassette domain-containing protein [Lachnospiraceae bacterium]